MDSSEAHALLTSESLALLSQWDKPSSPDDVVQMVSRLRAEGHPPERVHAVMTQLKLRPLAVAKFGQFASSMLFTPEGLEQATRLEVASHHAGRLQGAGITSVADCGCGIGGDALAFAGIGLRVVAIESDPATAALASYNLASFDRARVEIADVTTRGFDDVDALWIDPARRKGGSRTHNPRDWQPSLEWAFARASEKPTGIKLGPGIDRELIPPEFEAQWISHQGTLVELVVWSGSLQREGVGTSALVINSRGSAEMTSAADSPDEPVGDILRYLYEPDGAVIRARLSGDLARRYNATMIDPTIAYFSSAERHESPLAQGFEVLEVVPYSPARVQKLIASAHLGEVEIKKRGIDIDPAEFRKTLSLEGKNSATLILTRAGGKKVGILARRL
jgi:hypothetical protein